MRRDEEYVVRKALAIPDKKKGKGRSQATGWTTVSKPKTECHGVLKREGPTLNEKGKGTAEEEDIL